MFYIFFPIGNILGETYVGWAYHFCGMIVVCVVILMIHL